MIVAIDGPAGSGKSSTARALARRLGFVHVDSGAFYRAFAYVASRHSGGAVPDEIEPSLIAAVARAPVGAVVAHGDVELRLGDRPLTDDELRSPEVTAWASRISRHPEIREQVNRRVREVAAASARGIVCEGRDMGSVVFPDAELRVFLTAKLEERARRRLRQRDEPLDAERIEEEAARLAARDRADSERSVAPLKPTEGAEVLDTTEATLEEQVEAILAMVRRLDRGAESG